MSFPKAVDICEVSLRDGLQSVPAILTTEQKLALLRLIAKAGFPALEIGSLVSARAVPQMANTAEIWSALGCEQLDKTELRVLVVNPKGLLKAADMGMKHIQISVSASESHQMKNAGSPLSAMLPQFKEYSAGRGLCLSATISTAFGCPFEGKVSPDAVRRVAERLMDFGASEISLADTTGMAAPEDIYRLSDALRTEYKSTVWGLHLHLRPENLRKIVTAGLEAGIARFDSSLLGLGGCPFDDGNAGNVNTTELLRLLCELSIDSGVDLNAALAAEAALSGLLG